MLEIKSTPYGVSVSIDGMNVPELVDFELKAAVDEVVTAKFTTYATKEILGKLENAKVTIVLAGAENDDAAFEALRRRLQVVSQALANRSALVLGNAGTVYDILIQNVERYRKGDTTV